MKILGLLSIIFILEAQARDLRPEIVEKCLDQCKCKNTQNTTLKIDDCTKKPIEIGADFSYSTNKFTVIRFKDAFIKKIDANAFNLFQDLEHLEFVSSEIIDMHPQAFFKAELNSLSFSNSKFWNLTSIQCLDLEELVITNCNVKRIPKLDVLPSLTLLLLSGNKISAIKEKTFESLESLEEVYLNNNEITGLLPKLFYFNPQLTILDLSYNLLSSFVIEGTMKLEILSLSHNRLEVFDAASTKNLKYLKSLDLSHNKLTEIHQKTFKDMTYLEMLNLSYNQLTFLDNNTFSFNKNLEKLILDGNKFKTLPIFQGPKDVFSNMHNFSCRKCGLVSLSSFTFGSMPGLTQISLSDNNLEILDPKAFAFVARLEILDLSGNKLTKLGSSVFSDNKELVEINLSGNNLKTLNLEDFIDLRKLRKLDVSNSHLKFLWSGYVGKAVLDELEQLTISNNSIREITTEELELMPNLRYLDIENNPLQCTVHLANLIKWLTIHEVFSVEGINVLRRNEKLLDEPQYFEGIYDHRSQWNKLVKKTCVPSDDEATNNNTDIVMNLIIQNARNIDSVPIVDPPQPAAGYDDPADNDDEAEDDESEEDDEGYTDEIEDAMFDTADVKDGFSFDQVTNIISVTTVFVITALIVLLTALSITLIILKRHNTLNINNANLPRIKIPRWETIPSQKKHSGSIYRPLSEEILTPTTPKFNRYEFNANPTVHSSKP